MKTKSVEYGFKLALVCVIAMFGVAGAFVLAKDRIEKGKAAGKMRAIAEVLGMPAGATSYEIVNPDAPPDEQVFRFVTEDGETRYATQGAHQGFSSVVKVAVGVRLEGTEPVIRAVRVIEQSETPGLGTRIAEKETNLTLWSAIGNAFGAGIEEETDWFFLKRFRDKGLPNLMLTADPSEADEKILKITGVTITTNASVQGAKKALERIRETIR